MKLNVVFRRCVVSLSLLGMLTCQLAQATTPIEPHSTAIRDVALPASQVLGGQILDAEGSPQVGVAVSLTKGGAMVASTRTDSEGKFALTGVQAGVYQLQSASASGTYRVWAPQTAPPSASQGILLIAGQDVVRQQDILSHLANPYVLAAIVAAAIAIPLALDDDDPSGS
jgi:hypothetical protein